MNAEKSPVAHNVDHEEIAKFEAVASRWWDLEGEFKPLHRINPLRLGYIAERSGGLFGKKVLDVGCGGGILAESMAREGATVTGLDMGFEPLQVARLHALESGVQVEYVQETVEEHAAKHAHQYDLHGDAGARSRSAVCGQRLCKTGETGWTGLLLDHQPQRQSLADGRGRRGIRAAHGAERDARREEVHQACRTAGLG